MLCSLTLISPRLPPRCWALNHQDQSQHSFNNVSTTSALRIVKVSNFKFDVRSRRSHSCKSKLADLATATSAAYGVILLSGGLFAFNRSGSKGSLGGGLTGATVLATAYFLMQSQETKAIGDALGFGSAFLFSAVFGIRLAAAKKFACGSFTTSICLCIGCVYCSILTRQFVNINQVNRTSLLKFFCFKLI